MKNRISLAALITLLFGGIQAHGQSVIYNFSDGTADGWAASGFGGSPAATVGTFGGNNYIFGAVGNFQVLNVSTGDASSPLYQAMQAAAANPAGYDISYNYYIDTSTFGATPPTFMQLGTFVNTGDGTYHQDYSTPNEVSFNGSQMASGQVFQGAVMVNMAAIGFTMNPTNNFYRLGLIVNGNNPGANIGAYFTDISVTPVPEPTALALFGLAATGLWTIHRRRTASR
jgi:hypothetical protein